MEYVREKIKREMRSGVYTLLILKAVDDIGESYGYEIVKYLDEKTHGKIKIKDATVYPVLRYLSRKKIMESFWTDPSMGVPRKYYRLTPEGKKLLKELIKDYRELTSAVDMVLGGGEKC